MSDNPFETAEPWSVSTGMYLPVGNHRVKITKAEDATAKTSGKPQIELEFEDKSGRTARDWCPYSETFLDRVAALFRAAGVQLPQPGEYNEADHMRLTPKCIDRLHGKEIGIVIRQEPDYKDPSVMRDRVQGYIPADQIDADVPIETAGLPAAGAAAGVQEKRDDIPF